jgi:hypothetical protein
MGSKYAQKPTPQSQGQDKEKNGIVKHAQDHHDDEHKKDGKSGPLASTTTIAASSQTPPLAQENANEKTHDKNTNI